MKGNSIFCILILSWIISSCDTKTSEKKIFVYHTAVDTSKVLTRIAFGSCNDQKKDQPLWKFIIQNKPDLWIWLGDNIYGDSENPTVLEEKYHQQNANPEYQKLLQYTPIIGIWDDHDYGVNDGGKEYPRKKESQQLLLNFLDVPANAPQRKHEGAYSSYIFGKENRKIKIILLDSRYFRDRLIFGLFNGDMLGKAQWKWFENELITPEVELFIIGNGTQIIPEQHNFEKWSNFPKSRKKLFELMKEHHDKKFILLSGDRHMGEISKVHPKGFTFPVYEITSSGLTHFYESDKIEKNKYRTGKQVNALNFGLIEILWKENSLDLKLQIRGLNNEILTEENITYP